MNSELRGCREDGAPAWDHSYSGRGRPRPVGSSSLLSPCLTAAPFRGQGSAGLRAPSRWWLVAPRAELGIWCPGSAAPRHTGDKVPTSDRRASHTRPSHTKASPWRGSDPASICPAPGPCSSEAPQDALASASHLKPLLCNSHCSPLSRLFLWAEPYECMSWVSPVPGSPLAFSGELTSPRTSRCPISLMLSPGTPLISWTDRGLLALPHLAVHLSPLWVG